MKFSKMGIWAIICVSVVLLSTELYGVPVKESDRVTLNPNNQFLEIVNSRWWQEKTVVFFIDNELQHNDLKSKNQKERAIMIEHGPVKFENLHCVVPKKGKSIRITGVLKPGYRSLLVYSYQTKDSLLTPRFEVGNHGEDTFLYGKCLTLNVSLTNQYKLEAVQILHGDWLLRWHERSGQYTDTKMVLKHLLGRPDFEGEIRNPEGHLTVRGETKGRSMELVILQGQMAVFTWELRMNDRGNWVGEGKMDAADGAKGPVTLNIDYENKKIDYFDYKKE
jgi:hypothetical protein